MNFLKNKLFNQENYLHIFQQRGHSLPMLLKRGYYF
jgi:hypothetical protein